MTVSVPDNYPSTVRSGADSGLGAGLAERSAAWVGRRVLLAEHGAGGAASAARFVQFGLLCDQAGDGALAVAAVGTGHYAAVFLALDMPVLDGLRTARVLRALGYGGPIIALGALRREDGDAFEDDGEGGGNVSDAADLAFAAVLRQGGCDGHLALPVDAGALELLLHGMWTDGAARPAGGAGVAATANAGADAKDPAALATSDTGFEDLPAFAGFRAGFRAALAQRLAELEIAAADADWPTLAARAHTLKGTGGTFGFPGVSLHASSTELGARAADAAAVGAALEQLRAHIASLPDGVAG